MVQDLTPFLSASERSKSLGYRSIESEESEGNEELSKPDSGMISDVASWQGVSVSGTIYFLEQTLNCGVDRAIGGNALSPPTFNNPSCIGTIVGFN